jgi:hypothetical protein
VEQGFSLRHSEPATIVGYRKSWIFQLGLSLLSEVKAVDVEDWFGKLKL